MRAKAATQTEAQIGVDTGPASTEFLKELQQAADLQSVLPKLYKYGDTDELD